MTDLFHPLLYGSLYRVLSGPIVKVHSFIPLATLTLFIHFIIVFLFKFYSLFLVVSSFNSYVYFFSTNHKQHPSQITTNLKFKIYQ